MGFIRGALGVFVSVLLFIIFLIGGIILTLNFSLQYENVHEHLTPLINNTMQQELGIDISTEISKEISSMNISCEDYPGEYNFVEQGFSLTISCDILKNGTGAIINSGIEQIIYNVYYYNYTCSFWQCFKSSESPLPLSISSEQSIPLFLVSEYAKDYWRSKFYLALMVSIILMVLIFFLYEKKHNIFIIPGILLIAAAIPFLKIGNIISISGDKILFTLLGIFLSKAKNVFNIFFFTGIGLIFLGIIIRLFIIGFKISDFFKRKKQKEIKEDKGFKNTEEAKKDEKVKPEKKKNQFLKR